jgi:hypothetical protein
MTLATEELVIIGDEAWLPDEWEAHQRRRARDRAYRERNRDRIRAYQRAYRAANAERLRAYKSLYNAARRHPAWRGAIGSLHNLRCPGGHYATRNGCTPIPIRPRMQVAA